MTQLPLVLAIPRFKGNEERVDTFVNGDENAEYIASGGEHVPSIQNLIAEWQEQIDGLVETIPETAEKSFTGDGVTTTFTLDVPPASKANLLVWIGGSIQDTDDYSVTGTTLTITPAVATGLQIRTVAIALVTASGMQQLRDDAVAAAEQATSVANSLPPVVANRMMVDDVDGIRKTKTFAEVKALLALMVSDLSYLDPRTNGQAISAPTVLRMEGARPEYFANGLGISGDLIGTPSSSISQDTIAFQRALDTGDKVLGGDAKKYKLSGATMHGSQTLVGSDSLGKGSQIVVSHASNDILVMPGTDSDIEVKQFGFVKDPAITRTGGYIVRMGPPEGSAPLGSYHRLKDVSFLELSDPVLMNTNNRSELTDLKMYSCVGALATVVGGFNHVIRDLRTLNDPGLQPTYGIYVKEVGDLLISQSQLLRAGTCVFLDVAAAAGKEIASVWISDTYLDSSVRGLWARSSGLGKINRCKVSDSWLGGHTQQGVVIQQLSTGAIDGIKFSNCEIVLNGSDGLATSGFVKNIRDYNCIFAGNVGTAVSWGDGASRMSSESFVGANNGLGGNGKAFFVHSNVVDSLIAPKDLGTNTVQFDIGASALLVASGNTIKGAPGVRAINNGSAGLSASTTALVTHGLPFTPRDMDIKLTMISSLAATKMWVSGITSTQFTINVDAASTGFIAWEAKIPLYRG